MGQGRPNVSTQQGEKPDLSTILQHIQRLAEPVMRRVKEIEATLANGSIAVGSPDRSKLEGELTTMREKQRRLGEQYMMAKAQQLEQQGQTQQSQAIYAQLRQQQQASQGTRNDAQQNGPQGAGPGARNSPAPVPSPHQPHIPPEAIKRPGFFSGPSAPANGANLPGSTIPAQLNVSPNVPEPYPNSSGPRPTLSHGLGTNPILGTPAVLQRPEPFPASNASGSGSVGGTGISGWEDLLNVPLRESRVGGGGATNADKAAAIMEDVANEMGNQDYWDSLTDKGTGADSLLNAGSANASNIAAAAGAGDGRLLSKRKVQELVGEIDANERLEGDVEDVSRSIELVGPSNFSR